MGFDRAVSPNGSAWGEPLLTIDEPFGFMMNQATPSAGFDYAAALFACARGERSTLRHMHEHEARQKRLRTTRACKSGKDQRRSIPSTARPAPRSIARSLR